MSEPTRLTSDVALSRRQVQERAMRGSVWALVNVLVTLPLSVVVNAVTARILGPSEYGQLAFLLTALTLALPLTELGFGLSLSQWGVASEVTGDVRTTELLLRSRLGFALAVQLPLLCLGGLLVLAGEPWWALAVYVPAMLVTVLGAGAQGALLIQNRTATMAKVTLVVAMAVQVGVLFAAVAFRDSAAVWSARVAVSVLAPVLAIALVSPWFRRITLRPRFPRGLPSGFWRFALLSWLAGASALLVYSRSEVFVLRFYDEIRELGLFALAFGLSQQLTAPVDGVLAPLFPANAALAAGHPEDLRTAFLRSVRFFSLFAGALLCLAGPIFFLIPIAFGEPFRHSANLFLPLAVMSTFQSATSAATLATFARRRGALLATAFLVALGVDLGLAFALVPAHLAWGAVIANVVAQLTSVVALLWNELRVQRTTLAEMAAAARPWAFGLVALAGGLVVGAVAEDVVAPVAGVAVGGAASVLVFLAVLRATGGILTDSDARALLGVLPPPVRRPTERALSLALVRPPAPGRSLTPDDG